MSSSKGYIRQKYRLYPNKKQQEILNNYLGASRFVWNHFLDYEKLLYEETKKFDFSRSSLQKLLTELKRTKGYEWLNEIPTHALQNPIYNLLDAFSRFFKEISGFPRFKSRRKHYDSFTLPTDADFKIFYEEDKIQLAKLHKLAGLVKVEFHRPLLGKAKQITISREPSGKYYVSILCEVILCEVENLTPELVKEIKSAVGCDVGIKDLIITSDGEVFKNNKNLKRDERRLKIRQKRLSKKKKDSKNRERARRRVAKTHERIRNRRKDDIRQAVSSIVKNNDMIVLETLNVGGMLKNHKLAKAISDASFYVIKKEFEWQSKKRGKLLVYTDQWFPSSQTCSNCGYINKEVKNLKVREWDCPQCGKHHNRDINASINILHEGLRKAIEDGIIDFNQIPKELRKFTLTMKGEISKDPSLTNDSCSKDYQSKKPQNL